MFWRRYGHWLTGSVIALTGWALTYGLVEQQRTADENLAQVRFTEEVRSSTDAIAQRLSAYTEVVSGLRDLFLINPNLRFEQFEQVAAAHNHPRNYPEIRNLSFSRRVPANALPHYLQRMQEQAVRLGRPAPPPPSTVRDEYFLLEYLWPVAVSNEGIWGLDLATQPNNLAAMLASRDSGLPVISAPFQLLQEEKLHPAFMLRIPVFEPRSTTWVAGEQQEFLGAVAAAVDVPSMLESLVQLGFFRGIAVQIHDIGPPAQASAATSLPLGASSNFLQAEQAAYLAPQVRVVSVLDRRWRLEFLPSQPLLSAIEQMLPLWLGAGGALLALLLGGLASWLVRRHMRALAASEENFKTLFNQATVGMALADTQTGHLLQANTRYAHILGYTVEELATVPFQALMAPDDLAKTVAQQERLINGEIREYRMEKRMRHKEGHTVWVDVSISPMWPAGQAPTYHLAVIQDITEQHQMQDALRKREKQQRTILNHLPIGVYLVSTRKGVHYRNERFITITGYSTQEVSNLAAWWDKAYPDPEKCQQAQQRWQAQLAQAATNQGEIPPEEYRIQCGDGQERIVEVSGVMLDTEDYLLALQDLTARKAAEEKITYLEYYDPLTQLPNRRQLLTTLQRTLTASAQQQTYGAVLMLDIDHFKTVNEIKGHECGDALLQQVAERLRSCVQKGPTVARHGDDEFVVLLDNLSPLPGEAVTLAERMGQRILEVFRAPFVLQGEPYHTTASVGITLFQGMHPPAPELLKRADLAMYQAKTAGRDTLQFYSPNMHMAIQERVQMEAQMRTSLEQGDFELFYQPQVHANQVIGCEALIRWRHPERGLISPGLFIPLAEDSGQILALGQWVLRAACAQLAAWASEPPMEHLSIAINVSPRQFHQPDFVEQVIDAITQTGADPRHLELELTEGLLLQDVEDTIEKMLQLKRHGIAFSLDDFGTGYSSLAYLKRLPLNQLKIDQGFVRDILTDANDAAIARTVVALGTSLGLRVIAEGVETAAQRDFLQHNGCTTWQGYFFSRPLPAAEFANWVANFSATRCPKERASQRP